MLSLITNIPGIYPQRLEEILQIKKIVDDEFPFDELSKQIKGEFKFGFPVLAEIYQESSAQGLDQLMKTLTKIFKDEIVNIDGIIKIINKKIEQDSKQK